MAAQQNIPQKQLRCVVQLKTCGVPKKSVLFYIPRAGRKILDGVMIRKNHLWSLCSREGTSCLAGGRPLHRLIIHLSAVSLAKFRMLTRRCRVGSSSCSLNDIPRVPKVRLSLLRRHFVGFPTSICDVVSTFHGFARAAVFLRALTIVCVCTPPICTTFTILLECFTEMMLRVLVFFLLLD